MDQLKQLMDYTKFHIGVYVTLCTGLVAVLSMDSIKPFQMAFRPYLFGTLFCIAVAATFGGLVGSSIPTFKTYDDFKAARLGPWKLELIPGEWCAHLEHTAFWLGVAITIIGLWRVSHTWPF